MEGHGVDIKEANWKRLCAGKQISLASYQSRMMGERPRVRHNGRQFEFLGNGRKRRWQPEFDVAGIPKRQDSVSSVSEVVSVFTPTQALQMRGGADTDGEMRGASPNPRAMCCNFRLSARCQVCHRQLRGTWTRCGPAWCSKEEPGVLGGRRRQTARLRYIKVQT